MYPYYLKKFKLQNLTVEYLDNLLNENLIITNKVKFLINSIVL